MRTNTNQEIRKYLGSVDALAENLIFSFFGSNEIKLPIDIDGIINRLGVVCDPQDLGDDISGAIKIYNNNTAKIVFNTKHALVRQNFTKAHELGHLIAHHITKNGDEDPIVDYGNLESKYADIISLFIENRKNINTDSEACKSDSKFVECKRDVNSSSGNNSEEIFANRFAASILMPASQLSKYLLNGITSVDALATIFGVSKIAMEYRIKSLKIDFTEDDRFDGRK